MENNHIEVIAIDHGWANMKTVSQIFTSGVKEITTEPALFDNVLEYDNKYYKIGGKRLEVKKTKVEDENYYLLTLAAVAKELEISTRLMVIYYFMVLMYMNQIPMQK
nr:hypothetical protein [Lachnotalea glycerini]